MVSTLDSESSDPSSNLGGTSNFCLYCIQLGILLDFLQSQACVQVAVIAQLGER